MKLITACLSVAVALLAQQSAHAASPSQQRFAGCWHVVDPADDIATSDPDEVICLDQTGRGAVRESVIYGEGVKGCSRVATRLGNTTLTFVVDYTACTNDAPSHDIVCKLELSGKPERHCRIAMHPPRDAGKSEDSLDVQIVPEAPSAR